VEALMCL